jgi:hypothetical protein
VSAQRVTACMGILRMTFSRRRFQKRLGLLCRGGKP